MDIDQSFSELAPHLQTDTFDVKLPGCYGEFGSGAKVKPFFLQTTIPISRLETIQLVNEIPGTEKWPIQDLFQRDVDEDRVENEIMPYFENPEKVKFFSPLTLTLMPFANGYVIQRNMPRATDSEMWMNGRKWRIITRGDHYRIKCDTENTQFAILEWNSTNTKLVAIDGQHRLSTIKRLITKGSDCLASDIQSWEIPVLIASFRAVDEQTEPPSVVEVSRQLFSNINTEARTVNLSRQILLNDLRPNSILTQELIQRSHENDLEQLNDRNQSVLPLLFFDWRSNYESDVEPEYTAKGLKTVTEIHAWSENYLLGKGGSEWSKLELVFKKQDGVCNEVLDAVKNQSIPLINSKSFRSNIRQHLVPALAYLLENFKPYKNYIVALRNLEQEIRSSDTAGVAKHAFDELRYGKNFSLTILRSNIDKHLGLIERKIPELKRENIPGLFERAIGMRGVICAFAILGDRQEQTYSLEYSRAFTNLLNTIYGDGWFDLGSKTSRSKFIVCIAIDENERNIINFKHQAIPSALGNYISMLVSVYALERDNSFAWLLEDIELWKLYFENYRRTIYREYKKAARIVVSGLKEFELSGKKEIEQEIAKRSNQASNKRMAELSKELMNVSSYFEEIYDIAELQRIAKN